jgi:hypothetical protein
MTRIVLVHGAWHGAWCWDGRIGRTGRPGHRRSRSRAALHRLSGRRGRCPLSYRIGEPRSCRVRALVWWSGNKPSSHAVDECRSPCLPGRVRQHRRRIYPDRTPDLLLEAIVPAGAQCSFDPRFAQSISYGDSQPEAVAAIAPRLRPMVLHAAAIAATPSAPRSVPSTYIVLETERSLLKRNSRWRKGWTVLSSGPPTTRPS